MGERSQEKEAHVDVLEKWEDVDALIALFQEAACEQGWQAGDQLRAYGEHSVYFGAHIGDELAGGLHLVLGGIDSLPVLTVWPELCLQGHTDIADVALVALRPEYRARHDLLWRLFLTMWRWCDTHGIAELWSEVPLARLRLYNRLGWNLHVAGPARLHWGEECYPCRVGIEELAQAFTERAQTSAAYQKRVAQACGTLAARPAPAAEQKGAGA